MRLHDRFDILSDVPLAELRSAGAGAFSAGDQRSSGASCFALIADPTLPPRAGALTALRLMKHPALMTPLDLGPVDWPPAGRRCLAFICERPAGGRLVTSNEQRIAAWSDEDVIERLIQPLFPGLKALATENVAHRAIRPANILFRDAARRQAILGDCFTAPAGFDQPIAYETIEHGMTMPGGKGEGTSADDLYALGVTILYLLLGQPPGAGLSDEQLIDEKIRRGSFAALSGDLRGTSSSLQELLRGLLVDEPTERWTVREIDMWLQGRRMSPKSPTVPPRSARPLELGREQVFTARAAARALTRQGDQAVHLIRGHALEIWIQRTLGHKPTMDAFALAMADADDNAGNAGVHDARLTARVTTALDPLGPIRYRDLALVPDGFGCVLALAHTRSKDARPLVELLVGRLPQFWIRCQPVQKAEHPVQSIEFDRLRRLLDDHRPGLGMERLIYDANPMLHCLSPLIERDYVDQIADLLPALERAVEAGKVESLVVDRHIAAFVANRSKNLDDQVLTALGQPEAATRLLGQIYLMAFLQAQYGPASLPALTQLLGRQTGAVIERYRSRPTRDRLDSQLAGVLAEGSLVRLVHCLDNLAERQHDAQGYALARRQFGRAVAGLEQIEVEREKLDEASRDLGAMLAAAVSTVVGFGAIALSFLHFGLL
ncbi:hypothetical protein GCM10011611_23480 [Aliidongia dinghuensis]|uniref:Protein kinase domain-containing protein n=1 Tax=Aliidongia dinghuensis TaxID=1867774 RepID=A0A8J2YST9_9PROT|nr:hypothetical protein GCM10011611_23480 [Aliidongia dinghuensis]